MMALTEVRRAADVPEGSVVRLADAPGVPARLALANVRGEIFAIDDRCTHQGASLADGWLEDYRMDCPLHESRFDLRTGQPGCPPAMERVRTYATEVLDGIVYLKDGA